MTDVADGGMSRQRRAGAASRAETKRRLLAAAEAEFLEHGYVAATVSRIARRAEVTVQTLYLAWGSKRALLSAYMEQTLGAGAPYPASVIDRFSGLSPSETIEEIATLFVEIAARSAPAWQLYRDAAGSDPEIASDWDEWQRRRRGTFERILAAVPDAAFRDGLSRSSAIDTAWTIASPESYELLVRRAHYTPQQFREWTAETLRAALLPGHGDSDR